MTFSLTRDECDAVLYAVSNQMTNLQEARDALSDNGQAGFLFDREIDRLRVVLKKLTF